MKKLKTKTKKQVKQIAEILVKKYKPEKIILFGSAASGEDSPSSDLDILVIKKTNKQYFDRVFEAKKTFDSARHVDLIVLTPKEFDNAKAEKRIFIRQVLKYGVNLYENSLQ